MKSYAQEAEIKRLELLAGLITDSDVIAWADRIIDRTDAPDSEIIDLSLSGHNNSYEIISILNNLAAGSDRFAAMRMVLGEMYEVLNKDISHFKDFAIALWHFVVENTYNLPEEFYFFYVVDDELDLAEAGIYGSVDELCKQFIQDLKPFAETNLS
jgi:hypothetical protein